jgi:hypothetical protein
VAGEVKEAPSSAGSDVESESFSVLVVSVEGAAKNRIVLRAESAVADLDLDVIAVVQVVAAVGLIGLQNACATPIDDDFDGETIAQIATEAAIATEKV